MEANTGRSRPDDAVLLVSKTNVIRPIWMIWMQSWACCAHSALLVLQTEVHMRSSYGRSCCVHHLLIELCIFRRSQFCVLCQTKRKLRQANQVASYLEPHNRHQTEVLHKQSYLSPSWFVVPHPTMLLQAMTDLHHFRPCPLATLLFLTWLIVAAGWLTAW